MIFLKKATDVKVTSCSEYRLATENWCNTYKGTNKSV